MVMKYVQLGDFTTQAGAVIPQVRIAYEMWGQQRGNNVILVEHALTGDADACSWWPGLIGPGLVIDTDRYCVICTNVLGGCSGSTGPGTPAPDGRAWGSRFPALCIRDMVAAERQLLALLGIDELLQRVQREPAGVSPWSDYADDRLPQDDTQHTPPS